MAKNKTIGRISFSEEGYEKFVTLPKSKQLEKVYNSLSPKDEEQAELALKGIPNGDNISKGSTKQIAASNVAAIAESSSASGNARPDTDKG